MRPHIKADGIDRQGFTAIQEGSFFINDFSLIIVVRIKIVIDNVLVSVSSHIVSLYYLFLKHLVTTLPIVGLLFYFHIFLTHLYLNMDERVN